MQATADIQAASQGRSNGGKSEKDVKEKRKLVF